MSPSLPTVSPPSPHPSRRSSLRSIPSRSSSPSPVPLSPYDPTSEAPPSPTLSTQSSVHFSTSLALRDNVRSGLPSLQLLSPSLTKGYTRRRINGSSSTFTSSNDSINETDVNHDFHFPTRAPKRGIAGRSVPVSRPSSSIPSSSFGPVRSSSPSLTFASSYDASSAPPPSPTFSMRSSLFMTSREHKSDQRTGLPFLQLHSPSSIHPRQKITSHGDSETEAIDGFPSPTRLLKLDGSVSHALPNPDTSKQGHSPPDNTVSLYLTHVQCDTRSNAPQEKVSYLKKLSEKLLGRVRFLRSLRATNSKVPTTSLHCFPTDLTNQVTREGNDPVASGGFADIYRGTLRLHGKSVKVAIKAIKTYSGEDENLTKKEKRLRREVNVWLTLKHDNVLPFLGTTKGFSRFPAMVCPWAENGTLTSYLKDRHTDIPEIKILGLLDNVASGLDYLHSRSIVHGDLTGSNILINEDGSACIADFGLSTLLTELGGLSSSSHGRGTMRWMAPELLDLSETKPEAGSSKILPKPQSDVYSFGGVMLQILSGKVPYHYWTGDAKIVLAVSRGITPERPGNVLVTDRRWAFIQRCWSTVDSTRPTSGEIMDFVKREVGRRRLLHALC